MVICICKDVHDKDKSNFKRSKTNLIYSLIDTEKQEENTFIEFPFNSLKMLKRHFIKKDIKVDYFYYKSLSKKAHYFSGGMNCFPT